MLHVQVKVFRQAPETKSRAWDCSTKLAAWFEKAARHGDAAALLRRMADEPGLDDDKRTVLLCRTADAQVSCQAAQHQGPVVSGLQGCRCAACHAASESYGYGSCRSSCCLRQQRSTPPH